MLLTGLIVATGAVYTAVGVRKRYQKRKRRMLFLPNENSTPSSFFRKTQETIQRYTGNTLIAFSGQRRHQQLQAISSAGQKPDISQAEQTINRNLAVASGLLGLTIVASVGYPLLTMLSLPGFLYLYIPIFQRAYRQLTQERRIGMAVLDTVIASGMLILGYFVLQALFYMLVFLALKLIQRTQDNSRQRLVNIFGETPRTIWVCQGEIEVQIPFEDLQRGDIVVLHAGEVIPADGYITEGFARVDQRMLTGEAQPMEKGVNDPIFAGTMLLSGKIYIRVDKTGTETIAAQIGDILGRTADYKPSYQTRGEAISDRSALPMLALGAMTWPILGPHHALAALLANFGFHMRVLAPLSMLNFLNIASQQSILVKDGRALEALKHVDTILFDKTGTLTQDLPHVKTIYPVDSYTENDVLRYAAAAEFKQTHPIAQAILYASQARNVEIPPIDDAIYEVGYGLRGKVGGKLIRVGSGQFMTMEGVMLSAGLRTIQDHCHEAGLSLVYVAIDDHIIGAIELHPTVRPEAKRIINGLRQRGLTIYIVSGDHERPTQQLAQDLNIDHCFAETLPENKAKLVEQLQQAGKSVCFMGDGINDAIALKQANVSISLRGASTVATDTAQIVLMDESMNHLLQLFELAEHLDTNMQTNLIATIVPGVLCLSGIYFLHFGVAATCTLSYLGFVTGVTSAMLPAFTHWQLGDRPRFLKQ